MSGPIATMSAGAFAMGLGLPISLWVFGLGTILWWGGLTWMELAA